MLLMQDLAETQLKPHEILRKIRTIQDLLSDVARSFEEPLTQDSELSIILRDDSKFDSFEPKAIAEIQYQLNTSNPLRSVSKNDSRENVWYKLTNKISLGVFEPQEIDKPIFVVVQKQEPESGEKTSIWLNQTQWDNLFKLSPDLNADVQRLQKIQQAKNGALLSSSIASSSSSSIASSTFDLDSTQKTRFHSEPADNSIEAIVKFIHSFPDPQVGLEQTVKKFGIRLTTTKDKPRKPDGRDWLYPLSAQLARRLAEINFKFKTN